MQPAEPTPAEVRALVEAADRFHDARPWEQVAEEQVFGILDRERDEIAYASIAGRAGLEQGLSLFPGSTGRLTLLRMQSELLPAERDDLLLETRSLSCTFIPATHLLRIDQKWLMRAGLDPRRRKTWPQFISYEPGYGSWTLNGAEARLLRRGLEQALVMASAIEQTPDLLEEGMPREYLVRAEEDPLGSGVWSDWWMRPPNTHDPRAPELDDLTAARLARLPMAADREWEVDAMTGLGQVAEGPSVRPRVLRTLAIIERGSGYMHQADIFEAPDFISCVTGLFAARVLSIGYRPRRILVRDHDLRALLAGVAKAMDCKLLRVQYLSHIEHARLSLRDHTLEMERRD